MKKWKRVVDNKMRSQGDIDLDNRVIRVNKQKSKAKSSVIDTIVHEEMHRVHPQIHEKNIRRLTSQRVSKMSYAQRQRLYSKYS